MKLAGKTITYIIIAMLGSIAMAYAQSAKPCLSPKSPPIEFTIKFDGPDASKFVSAQVQVSSNSTPPPGQQNFNTSFWSQPQRDKPSPVEFKVSLPIPENAASGEYTLVLIRAASAADIVMDYNKTEFDVPPKFQVCNPDHFEKPKIKSVTERP